MIVSVFLKGINSYYSVKPSHYAQYFLGKNLCFSKKVLKLLLYSTIRLSFHYDPKINTNIFGKCFFNFQNFSGEIGKWNFWYFYRVFFINIVSLLVESPIWKFCFPKAFFKYSCIAFDVVNYLMIIFLIFAAYFFLVITQWSIH